MDVPLYAIALIVFSVLYLGIGVFLGYTLLITLIIMFMYLAIRHGNVAQNYPHSLGDTLVTVIFIGVTWGIFTYLAPKNPIPFLGAGFTYTNQSQIPISAIIIISFVLAVVYLVVLSFIAQRRDRGAPGGIPSQMTGEEPPKQGVGAG
jgi:mannose/fructose/N-acetylgalactosamine-specific phosphotransferase system component IIC